MDKCSFCNRPSVVRIHTELIDSQEGEFLDSIDLCPVHRGINGMMFAVHEDNMLLTAEPRKHAPVHN